MLIVYSFLHNCIAHSVVFLGDVARVVGRGAREFDALTERFHDATVPGYARELHREGGTRVEIVEVAQLACPMCGRLGSCDCTCDADIPF